MYQPEYHTLAGDLNVDVQTWEHHPEGQRIFISTEPYESAGLTPTEMDSLVAWWTARRAAEMQNTYQGA